MTDDRRCVGRYIIVGKIKLNYIYIWWHSSRASVALQPSSKPIEHRLHQKSSLNLTISTAFTRSINCFFARKSSLKWLFVGKYRTVLPRICGSLLWYWYHGSTVTSTVLVPWKRSTAVHGSTVVPPNTSVYLFRFMFVAWSLCCVIAHCCYNLILCSEFIAILKRVVLMKERS